MNHDFLLSKLVHYGIRGQANNWFIHSYLTQRVQFTSVNRFNSQLHLIFHGSVLGPLLLFIIFINDLHKSIRHSQMLHFADDTNPKRKQITKHLNFRISGQKIEISTRVKYLGIQIDQHLNWNEHIKNIVPKLSRALGVLSKICHYVPKFNSHLIHAYQGWGQNEKCLKKLSSL